MPSILSVLEWVDISFVAVVVGLTIFQQPNQVFINRLNGDLYFYGHIGWEKKLTMSWVRVPRACHGWTPGLLRKYIGKAFGFGYCYGNINKTFF